MLTSAGVGPSFEKAIIRGQGGSSSLSLLFPVKFSLPDIVDQFCTDEPQYLSARCATLI